MYRLYTLMVVASLAGVARADFASHDLVGAGSLSGSTSFITTNSSGTFNVTVDYAVFNPGDYTGTFTPFTSLVAFPSVPAGDYIYAYQLFVNGPVNAALSPDNLSISGLSIGLAGANSIDSLGHDAATAGTGAAWASAGSTSAFFKFASPALAPDTFSQVLLMASSNLPDFATASIFNGGSSTSGLLPSPAYAAAGPDVITAPLPPALWGGMALLGAVGFVRKLRARND